MTDDSSSGPPPDPSRIATPRDFGRELTLARNRAGLTVRKLAAEADMPVGTVSGYLTGEHLPQPTFLEPFRRILSACGEGGPTREAAWEEALYRARRSPGRRATDSRSPYRGLDSFQTEHAESFRGRDGWIQLIVNRLTERLADGGLLLVVGPSGAGKSSLLRAGVVPALARSGVSATVVLPGARPLRELGSDGEAGARSRSHVLIIDQFEEIFGKEVTAEDRKAFVEDLGELGLKRPVVMVMRADFYPQALEYALLVTALQDGQVVVGPMTAAELRAAIIEPARLMNIDVDDSLVEVILRDLAPRASTESSAKAHDAGALPLLSHALLAAWQHSRGNRLTVGDYLAGGGVAGSIAQTADAVFADLTPSQQDVARHVFLRLVQSNDEGANTRRRVTLSEIGQGAAALSLQDVEHVLDSFVVARFITVDDGVAEITHEALLSAWPRLRDWLETDRDWLRLHRRLTAAATEWQESGRDPERLYGGGALQAVGIWLDSRGYRGSLNGLESDFLRTSAQRQASMATDERRRIRRRYRLLILMSTLLVVAVSSVVFTGQVLASSARQRDQTLSRYVADESNRLRGHDVSLAMQLALAAYRISPTPEARASLIDSTDVLPDDRRRPTTGPATTMAVSGDGRVLAAGTSSGAVQLWLSAGSEPVTTFTVKPSGGSGGSVTSIGLSAGGGFMAVGDANGALDLWAVAGADGPRSIGTLAVPCGSVTSLAVSDSGHMLAQGCTNGAVYLWDVANIDRPSLTYSSPASATSVTQTAFAPDGRVLAVASHDSTIRLWNIADRAHPVPLSRVGTPGSTIFDIVISPDGRTLAAGTGKAHSVCLWNIAEPADPIAEPPLTGPASWVDSVAFSPDGRTLAAGSSDGLAWIFDLRTHQPVDELPHPRPVTMAEYTEAGTLITLADDGVVRTWRPPGPVITGAKDTIFALSYDSDGRRLGVGPGADDDTLTIYDTTDIQDPRQLGITIHNTLTTTTFSGSGALTPDGRTFAVGDTDGTVQLWDVGDPAAPVLASSALKAANSLVEAVTISPQAALLAVSNDDGTVPLYDISNSRAPIIKATIPAVTPGSYTYQAQFSPDGHLLAVASSDHHGYLWDVSDPSHPRRLADLGGFTDAVYTAAFDPKADLVAVGSADGSVRLWDIKNPTRPASLGQPLTGPIGYIYSIAYDPVRHLLAVGGSTDGTVWLWDLADPRHPKDLATLTGPVNGVLAVAFSPDGHTLVAGGHDRAVHIWDVDPAADAAWICANAGLRLTPQEWLQYIPSRGYDPQC